MTEDFKISNKQFLLIVILFSIGTAILITPSRLANDVKQDAWIPTLLAVFVTILIIWLYNMLSDEFPNMTIIQYMEKILGKWIGRTVSLMFSITSLLVCVNLFSIVGQFITTQIMPETPIMAIYILYGCVIVFGVRLGVESLAKSAEIFFPWVIILFTILIILLLPDVEFKNIKPTLEFGFRPIIRSTILYISIFSLPLVFLLTVFPVNLKEINKAKKSFHLGILIGGIVLFIITVMCILVLGHETTSRSTFPVYVLAKKINIGNFIERIEVILAIIWLITIFIKTSFYFYAGIKGIAQTLNLKDYCPLTLPVGMIVIASTRIFFPNNVYTDEWDIKVWFPLITIFGFLMPILLLIVSKIRKIIKK